MILDGKSILITGGTGSLGKTLVRRLLRNELGRPRKIIVFSRDEAKQHDMRVAYKNKTVASEDDQHAVRADAAQGDGQTLFGGDEVGVVGERDRLPRHRELRRGEDDQRLPPTEGLVVGAKSRVGRRF